MKDSNNSWVTRLDYFFVLRPMLFFPGWSTMLAGFFIAYKHNWMPWKASHGRMDVIGLLLVSFAMLMGASFILNQLRDVQSDRENNKLFLISDGFISRQNAMVEVLLLSTTGLVLISLINYQVFLAAFVFLIVTGYLYNFPPTHLKDRPWGSLLANAGMGWLAFAVGWLVHKPASVNLIIESMPYLFFNVALYLFTTLPDMKGDKRSSKNTLAVRFGLENVVLFAFVLFSLSLVFAFVLDDRQALVFCLFSLPFFLLTLFKRNVEATTRTTKFSVLFFALSICLRWPVYFLLMLSGFFCTKFYFKKRFNLDYPNFSGN